MLKYLVFVVGILFYNTIYAQADPSSNYYNQGVAAFQKYQFAEADSFYTLSIRILPSTDAYFNRAMARLKLDNKTGYFEDLMAGGILGDKESLDMFKMQTVRTDTLRYKTTIVTYNLDSTVTSFKHIIYTLQNMSQSLDLKYNAQNSLVNVNWFQENSEDTTLAEENTSYRGGLSAMQKFMRLNMRYPKKAINEDVSGKVYLKFVINPAGCVERVMVIKGIKECVESDAEAVRLLLAMPRWKPARIKGKAVKSQITLPFNFKIQ